MKRKAPSLSEEKMLLLLLQLLTLTGKAGAEKSEEI